MYFRTKLLSIVALFLSIGFTQAQNTWSYPDIDITIYPEVPAVCPGNIIEVGTLYEYATYEWTKDGIVYGNEQTIELEEPGEYEVAIEAIIDGVTCQRFKTFEVIDLADPDGIKEYLEAACFYPVPIWREELPTGAIESTDCEEDMIKFTENGSDFTSIEAVANAVLTDFKPLKNIDGEEYVFTKNECFCEGNINDYLQLFQTGDKAIWAHEWFASDDDYQGLLYTKARMPFEPELPTAEQKAHFESIHDDLLDANTTAYDQAEGILQNNFMANPIGGYEIENSCEVPNDLLSNFFLTPAEVAVKIPSGAANIHFANDEFGNNVAPGALLKLDLPTAQDMTTFTSYLRLEDELIFNGYYSTITNDFLEDFETSNDICQGCEIELTYLWDACNAEACEFRSGNYFYESTEDFELNDGGFDLLIAECNAPWRRSPVSDKESAQFVYNLLCAIKSQESTFSYAPKFTNKVIIAKDIYVGGHHYPVVGVTTPEFGDEFELFEFPNIVNKEDALYGFEDAYEISPGNRDIRLNLFSYTFLKTNCKDNWLDPSYSLSFWPQFYTDVFLCLKQAETKVELGEYLNPSKDNNLLIFVNGYRPNRAAVSKLKWYNSDNEHLPAEVAVNPCNDYFGSQGGNYWGQAGKEIAEAIEADDIIYVDGHHSIETSNHRRILPNPAFPSGPNFSTSVAKCAKWMIPLSTNSPCTTCAHNTLPNDDGFDIRYNNGLLAGENIFSRILAGEIKIKTENIGGVIKIAGNIDIVAHSMGYVFAKGMNDYLKNQLTSSNSLGNFYIVAPENALGILDAFYEDLSPEEQAVYRVDHSDYEEIWQFGSNFLETDICHRDGVAPQAKIRGLDPGYNIFIPQNLSKFLGSFPKRAVRRSFLEAHYMKNYDWIAEETDGFGDPILKKRGG